ncbi:MAG TPA: hypothetical protein VKB80_37455 [Kofleriaceae bacterium]|nr:hypothetical protein [Kofleriaceae bacterium]
MIVVVVVVVDGAVDVSATFVDDVDHAIAPVNHNGGAHVHGAVDDNVCDHVSDHVEDRVHAIGCCGGGLAYYFAGDGTGPSMWRSTVSRAAA